MLPYSIWPAKSTRSLINSWNCVWPLFFTARTCALLPFVFSAHVTFTAVGSQTDGGFVHARRRKHQFSWATCSASLFLPWSLNLHLINILQIEQDPSLLLVTISMLANANINLCVVPRNKIYTETLKWIPRTIHFLQDLIPQSSSESTKASGMCVSLTSFWFNMTQLLYWTSN